MNAADVLLSNPTQYPIRTGWLTRVHLTPDGCLEWTGALEHGYGKVSLGTGVQVYLHRLLMLGEDVHDASKWICHRCNNSRCINTTHLYVGDAKTNYRDRVQARGHIPIQQGEDNPNAKLTEVDVRKIKAALATGESFTNLAARYNVTKQAIYLIAKNKNWAWVK